MKKRIKKLLVESIVFTMVLTMCLPLSYIKAEASVNIDALYKSAYESTLQALSTNQQKDLTSARVLVDNFYFQVKGTGLQSLGETLSSMLDKPQQEKLVEYFQFRDKAVLTATQSDINAARFLIIDMPEVWRNAYSSDLDTPQQTLINKANIAMETVKTSKLQKDKETAQLLLNELKTALYNDGVVAWANIKQTELDAIVIDNGPIDDGFRVEDIF